MSNQGPYDQGYNQGDMGGYNTYEHQPDPQPSPYYQNNSYPESTPAHFSAPPPSGYNHGYSKYEGTLPLRLT